MDDQVCQACGAHAADEVKHTRWHELLDSKLELLEAHQENLIERMHDTEVALTTGAAMEDATEGCEFCHRPWSKKRNGIEHTADCIERCPACGSTWNAEEHITGCPRLDTCGQIGPPWVVDEHCHPDPPDIAPKDWRLYHQDHMKTVAHDYIVR